jgi:basic membrane lipoprotein Med (substrate-binding protein (PBP1-ABC) superfamily)
VNYTNDSSDSSVCERIATHQIAEGSTTVYADAGTGCSPGALSAAADAGVWAIGSDPSTHGAGILASTVKRLGVATTYSIGLYLGGGFQGLKPHHFDIGIEGGAIALVDYNRAVSASVLTKLAQVQQQMMPTWKGYATPQN